MGLKSVFFFSLSLLVTITNQGWSSELNCPVCPPKREGTIVFRDIALMKQISQGKVKTLLVRVNQDGRWENIWVYFYSPNNPECERIENLLKELSTNRCVPFVMKVDVTTEEGTYLREVLNSHYGLSQEKSKTVPCIFTEDTVLVGEENILCNLP